jgi:hypothetical protein
VIEFRVLRADLANLEILSFVRGDYNAEEYWSFVQHCRSSRQATRTKSAIVRHHERDASGNSTWYDLVCGPVAAFWMQRSAMLDTDQYGFHTPQAVGVLNDLIRKGSRGTEYEVEQVIV